MIRVVVDPGVFVSAFVSPKRAAPALLVEALLDGQVSAVVSPALLDELTRVLRREKFAAYSGEGRADAFVAVIADCGILVEDADFEPGATDDPDDDYLVALARANEVDAIVAGDRHLLAIDSEELNVWSPRVAVEQIEASVSGGGEHYLRAAAEVLIGLRQAADIEHLALVVVRPAAESLVLHVTPNDLPWWGASHDPGDLRILEAMISTVRTADESDITSSVEAFDVETRTSAPIDEVFGAVFWSLTQQAGGERAVLMARDAVERVWLAWRLEQSRVFFVEEAPGFFDEHLKFIDAISRESLDGNVSKPPLRLADVGAPRRVQMAPELRSLLDEQAAAFREKFGREPGPGDPVFFDPDADEPRPMSQETIDRMTMLMEEAGFGKEFFQQRDTALAVSGMLRRISRNDPCPCGSGERYKHCHGG
ncbi:MAG TPA: putative toxin-antitoxin system toxin component, PIN family [Conexibacter sp.]